MEEPSGACVLIEGQGVDLTKVDLQVLHLARLAIHRDRHTLSGHLSKQGLEETGCEVLAVRLLVSAERSVGARHFAVFSAKNSSGMTTNLASDGRSSSGPKNIGNMFAISLAEEVSPLVEQVNTAGSTFQVALRFALAIDYYDQFFIVEGLQDRPRWNSTLFTFSVAPSDLLKLESFRRLPVIVGVLLPRAIAHRNALSPPERIYLR